jgi:hypothetical protein
MQHVPNLLAGHCVPTRSARDGQLREERDLADHGEAMRERFLGCRDVGAVAADFGMTAPASAGCSNP